jgi:ribose-phosphate pyrophosphokinase
MIIFSTEKYNFLKQNMLKNKKFKNGEIQRKNFEDGEKHHQIVTSVLNQDVLIVGGTIDNDDMMEIYELSCAVIKYGAKTLHIVIPFFGYSTQERALKNGEIVKAKTRARMLSFIPQASNGNFIYLLEIHALGIPHYFEGSVHCQNIEVNELLIKQIKKLKLGDFVLASADMGNSKKIQTLASMLNVDTAFVIKKRHSKGVLSETTNNRIKGQAVLIYDDMIRSGKSVIEAVKIYKNEVFTLEIVP